MNQLKLILMPCFFILFNSISIAQPTPDHDFSKWLTAAMQKESVPAVSIVVVKNYHILWAKGYGVTDKQKQQLVSINTLFQAGSISKPVTAMAALKAVQDKLIFLDKNINLYLTTWKLPENRFTKVHKVTLRMLLNHSGGINVHGFIGYINTGKLPSLVEILNGIKPANSAPVQVIEKPGTRFIYSGGGYTIIQQLLIDTYHQSFATLMSKIIFQPLGMSHSTFEQPLPKNLMAYSAMPYRPNGQIVKEGPHIYIEQAAAGLWTTPSDLAQFMISLQRSLAHKTNQILNAHYAVLMIAPTITDHMGLGLETGMDKYGKPNKNGAYFIHHGENEGYQSILIGHIKNGNGLVIMTNVSPDETLAPNQKKYGWSFIDSIVKRIADMEQWE